MKTRPSGKRFAIEPGRQLGAGQRQPGSVLPALQLHAAQSDFQQWRAPGVTEQTIGPGRRLAVQRAARGYAEVLPAAPAVVLQQALRAALTTREAFMRARPGRGKPRARWRRSAPGRPAPVGTEASRRDRTGAARTASQQVPAAGRGLRIDRRLAPRQWPGCRREPARAAWPGAAGPGADRGRPGRRIPGQSRWRRRGSRDPLCRSITPGSPVSPQGRATVGEVLAGVPHGNFVQALHFTGRGLAWPLRQRGLHLTLQLRQVDAQQVVVKEQGRPARHAIGQRRAEFGAQAFGQPSDAQRQGVVGLFGQGQQQGLGTEGFEADHSLVQQAARRRRRTASDSGLSPCTQRLSAVRRSGLPS